MTTAQCGDAIGRLVEKWNSRPHGERKSPPLEHYESAELRRVPREALDFVLQTWDVLRVRHGAVKLRGQTYLSDQLALLSSCWVMVRADPGEGVAYAYPGDGRRLALRELQDAAYGEWGEPNRRVASARKAQRQLIREIGVAIKGACPRSWIDLTGAYEAIGERLKGNDAEVARQRQAATQALREAGKQQQALREAEKPEKRPESVYEAVEKEYAKRRRQLRA